MIPTALSPREVACLKQWAINKRVVEAGALLGYSTVALSAVASHVISIDKHEGYTGPTLKPFMHNIWQYGNANVLPVVGDALAELPKFDAQFGFIDLTGKEALTRMALQATRAPIVGIHDYGRSNCEGVAEALKDYKIIEVVDTLAIVENKNYA